MRIVFATLLGAALVCTAHSRAAALDTEIVSEGEVDGKLLFRVNGVTVMASEGDIIDGCMVTRRGLECKGAQRALPDSGGLAAEVQKLRLEKQRCEDDLARAEQGCHERYQANIRDFTESLKKKNYELAEKTKEIEELKADLSRGDRVISALRGEEAPSPLPVKPKTAAPVKAASGKSTDNNVLGILASLEAPPAGDSGKKRVVAPERREKSGSATNATRSAATPGASAAASTDTQFVAIRQNWSNLRAAPGVQSAIVSQGLTGDIFPVLSKSKDGWYEVRLDDGGAGWVAEDIVATVTPPTQPVSATNAASMARAGHLRAAANPRSRSVGVVPAGEALTLIEQTRNWLKVSRPGGGEGWLHRSMVRPGGE